MSYNSNEYTDNLPAQISLLSEILGFFVSDSVSVAHGLLDRFRNIQSVFSASENELLKVEGMNDKAAKAINSVPRISQEYINCVNNTNIRVFNSESACAIIKPKFCFANTEKIVLLILNSRGQVMFNEVISEGSIHMVPVYIKNVMRLCLDYQADTVIIAHNHPSGNPVPTESDILATKELQLAMESIYVTLYDHIVFADDDYISMRASGWLRSITKTTDAFRHRVIKDEEGI